MKYVDEKLSDHEDELIQNFIGKDVPRIEFDEIKAMVHMMYIMYKNGTTPAVTNFIQTINPPKVELADWEIWAGWRGNHDHRIDDAKCSNCGYEYPKTVYKPSDLPEVCPGCYHRMKVKEK